MRAWGINFCSMQPIEFPGSTQIGKPQDMTDEQCFSVWATAGIDADGFAYYMTCWKPSYEDIKAIQEGRPIYVKVLAKTLPPMALFTLNENDQGNF
jgi:hypothetical protein